MRHAARFLPPILVLCLFPLLLTACGGEDDPADPAPETTACSIKVTSPELARVFESSDEINIRWDHTGSESEVAIELYKNAVLAGVIADATPNDGRYTWLGSTMGQEPGDDFNIKVTAAGDSDCYGLSPTFAFSSTEGCELTIDSTNLMNTLYAGTVCKIQWDSYHGSGLVDILLVNWNGTIGTIALGAPDAGSYSWLVDSFNFGTYDFYMLRIEDHLVPGCDDQSEMFKIVDDDVCSIRINQPDTWEEWKVGETEYILYSEWSDDVEFINIELYTGTVFLGDIAVNAPVGAGVYEWVVTDFGNAGAEDYYKIRIENASDPYCDEESAYFTIFRQ